MRYSIVYRGALLLVFTLLAACASLPTDYTKNSSTALRDTSHTQLAQKVQPLVVAHPGESGFYPMHDGVNALAARLRLIDQAEVGIDLQYFMFHPDLVGDLMLKHLVDATSRGVRVRLLLDDISTEGYEQAFSVLEANPNFEIRLVNPFATRISKLANLNEFQRINHRMHNK